ncbi:MAG: 4-hydroxy-tetrahydrodipicolinate reductase [Saprospiraceae bacterium]|nr:4-hydroxy-tetrahydrodipicolinate reductase [Saprospiraceae bacterium]
MKIALIGYGKMGKTIENIAQQRGHEIVLRLDVHNPDDFARLNEVDVAIEFTRPESAFDNLKRCVEAKVPVICGTTGWLQKYKTISDLCMENDSAFFYASNYSIGVNIFFEINKRLAAMMDGYPMYDVRMTEIHHTQKLDAPSGTAITLANGITENIARKTNWVCNTEGTASDVPIVAKRIDPAPGTHIVTYDSPIDSIEITHTAHSREGFATGAVLAAEWIVGKKGVFSMKDMLGF